MNYAPIIIFCYNRPEHTQKCITALMNNDGWENSDVFIYCDGPKDPAKSDRNIESTRLIAENTTGCKSLAVIKSSINKGLYNSVLDGVGEVIKKYDRVIVVEDDLVTDPSFLNFMNTSLEKYNDNNNVACVSGYVYPLKVKFKHPFFIRGADCWGWATWKNRWEDLQTNATQLLSEIENVKKLEEDFTFNYSYPYLQMLRDRAAGLNQSWAILWYASSFLKNRLCLYPSQSLVSNIGNDGSGTHTFIPTSRFNNSKSINVNIELPDEVEEDAKARRSFEIFFKSLRKPKGLLQKAKAIVPDAVKSKLKKILVAGTSSPWSGDYSSWEDAKSNSSGYDSSIILEKVKDSVLKVKRGEAVYERDSVLFDTIEYSEDVFHLFNSILEKNNELKLLDFGGSLGSSYFQYSRVLNTKKPIRWGVVEQKHFVETGKKEIEDEQLKFFETIDEAVKQLSPDVLLLSSVLPYIEKPFGLLDRLMHFRFKYIVIDRTPFISRENDRLTVQEVPRKIYFASYPSWFFNETRFKKYFSGSYTLVREFDCKTDPREYLGKDFTYRKGFIFKLKDEA